MSRCIIFTASHEAFACTRRWTCSQQALLKLARASDGSIRWDYCSNHVRVVKWCCSVNEVPRGERTGALDSWIKRLAMGDGRWMCVMAGGRRSVGREQKMAGLWLVGTPIFLTHTSPLKSHIITVIQHIFSLNVWNVVFLYPDQRSFVYTKASGWFCRWKRERCWIRYPLVWSGGYCLYLTTPLTIDRLSNNCPLAIDLTSGKRRCPRVREMERDKGHMKMMELCTNNNVLHNCWSWKIFLKISQLKRLWRKDIIISFAKVLPIVHSRLYSKTTTTWLKIPFHLI
jgi:hypothetical protein